MPNISFNFNVLGLIMDGWLVKVAVDAQWFMIWFSVRLVFSILQVEGKIKEIDDYLLYWVIFRTKY